MNKSLTLFRKTGASGAGKAGQSLVELSLALPILISVMLATADLGRAFYAHVTLGGAAQKGALYGSSSSAAASNATGIQSAVLADTTTLFNTSPSNPTVTSSTGTDPYSYSTVTVSVTYSFQTLFPYPGIPASYNLSRSVKMRVKP